ncbi:hypothetical protein CY34DRAFT_799052 [Suillus luteus UH-Slu-Lm8-n1]|uniref:Uncharacterized protein n=1 Tax=Suillus luteus UH-Slu-Lm8-n1 TaxID=930992 RepID=A0A0D0BBQ5_9AGAM|nr:hypothetical protein CY34DRAFT_806716 [Suillus luteus UH-Slu-Lm8-n1]KIK47751.1 hypothetical protein CY34DRAFT_799052 [Suillus luteus UH-Slu-Lm8-n1]
MPLVESQLPMSIGLDVVPAQAYARARKFDKYNYTPEIPGKMCPIKFLSGGHKQISVREIGVRLKINK